MRHPVVGLPHGRRAVAQGHHPDRLPRLDRVTETYNKARIPELERDQRLASRTAVKNRATGSS